METHAHLTLKQLAMGFLRETGCRALAAEVQCPISRYRVDVAGYVDATPFDEPAADPGRTCRPPYTVMIECKQSREDFLRDRDEVESLTRQRSELERIARAIEHDRIMREEPQLRKQGGSLFPELDDWDFTASSNPGYRRLQRKLQRIDRKLHGQTKFHLMARYRLADRLYLAAPTGLVKRRELPSGFGLLECPRSTLAEPGAEQLDRRCLRVVVPAPDHRSAPVRRLRLLRNIAVAATSAAAAGPSAPHARRHPAASNRHRRRPSGR